jgi:hypothetical protein
MKRIISRRFNKSLGFALEPAAVSHAYLANPGYEFRS